jgi:hypothetical protein
MTRGVLLGHHVQQRLAGAGDAAERELAEIEDIARGRRTDFRLRQRLARGVEARLDDQLMRLSSLAQGRGDVGSRAARRRRQL